MFEILEHTADIGFRARGRTLGELFENSALALLSIAREIEDVSPREEYPLEASGHDRESLLVNWLSEVLYAIDGSRLALHHCRVAGITETRVNGFGAGEPGDPTRHRAKLVVKGVTYHQLRIAEGPDDWYAEVYLDI